MHKEQENNLSYNDMDITIRNLFPLLIFFIITTTTTTVTTAAAVTATTK